MDSDSIKLIPSWKRYLEEEFHKPYMANLKSFLVEEYKQGKTIYPTARNFFAALNTTPLEQVKVVILGQDPYHGPQQAHGLSFSVSPGITPPPSLINIFKELQSDLNITPCNHGYLLNWAQQGVLLINAVLSVEAHHAASHRNRGWEQFTDKIIETINNFGKPTAFILWGGYAQKKAAMINQANHLVISSPHPSPLSAYKGFFGSKPFSRANRFLEDARRGEINWKLPELAETATDQLLTN